MPEELTRIFNSDKKPEQDPALAVFDPNTMSQAALLRRAALVSAGMDFGGYTTPEEEEEARHKNDVFMNALMHEAYHDWEESSRSMFRVTEQTLQDWREEYKNNETLLERFRAFRERLGKEQTEIRERIATSEKELSHLNDEMSALHDELKGIEEAQQGIFNEMDRRRESGIADWKKLNALSKEYKDAYKERDAAVKAAEEAAGVKHGSLEKDKDGDFAIGGRKLRDIVPSEIHDRLVRADNSFEQTDRRWNDTWRAVNDSRTSLDELKQMEKQLGERYEELKEKQHHLIEHAKNLHERIEVDKARLTAIDGDLKDVDKKIDDLEKLQEKLKKRIETGEAYHKVMTDPAYRQKTERLLRGEITPQQYMDGDPPIPAPVRHRLEKDYPGVFGNKKNDPSAAAEDMKSFTADVREGQAIQAAAAPASQGSARTADGERSLNSESPVRAFNASAAPATMETSAAPAPQENYFPKKQVSGLSPGTL